MGEPGENALQDPGRNDGAAHLRVESEQGHERGDGEQRVEEGAHHLVQQLVQDHVGPLDPHHQIFDGAAMKKRQG